MEIRTDVKNIILTNLLVAREFDNPNEDIGIYQYIKRLENSLITLHNVTMEKSAYTIDINLCAPPAVEINVPLDILPNLEEF